MVRPYEMMVLFHPELEDHKVAVDEVGELVKSIGGEIAKVDLWGKRRLAYPIQKKEEGFYAVYAFNMEPSQVKELRRRVRLQSSVMRHMLVRPDA
ncbi:30S ribosomal protein S6 [Acetomicrobium sp. S15 = DSM 107314]|uniref:30S ribosomal protein S6 n=1 Tax=Acetomicrobium sp. S15 = DSM 107314 TaxID=2529858 RepID=UPI003158A59F